MKVRKFAPIGVTRYSSDFLIRSESTPDHIVELVPLSIMIHHDLEELGIKLDLHRLIFKVAIHDLDEACTGDIRRPFKYKSPNLRNEIKEATTKMMEEAGFFGDLIYEINNDKDDSIEGFLLGWLDNLQVVLKLYEEVKILGNLTMESELIRAYKLLESKSKRDIIDTLDSTGKLRSYLVDQLNSINI